MVNKTINESLTLLQDSVEQLNMAAVLYVVLPCVHEHQHPSSNGYDM